MSRPTVTDTQIDLQPQIITNSHNIVTMADLRLAKGLARTLVPTTSPDFPLPMLFKPLLPSNGTAPWKRHSLTGHAPDVVQRRHRRLQTSRPTISKILINLTTNIPMAPYMLPTLCRALI